MQSVESEQERASAWREGLVLGAGMGVGVFALAVGFGAAAVAQDWPAWLTVLMSAIVFGGGAQFALVLAYAGGGMLPALGAATLINLRFVPMALTAQQSLKGGRWRRSLEAQAVVDSSWAAARRPDGSISREKMIAVTLAQWPAWIGGTAAGAYLAPRPELARAFGLDLIFPAFFLVVVLDILRNEPSRCGTAALAAVLCGVLCWWVPPGMALLLSGLAALPALRAARGSAA